MKKAEGQNSWQQVFNLMSAAFSLAKPPGKKTLTNTVVKRRALAHTKIPQGQLEVINASHASQFDATKATVLEKYAYLHCLGKLDKTDCYMKQQWGIGVF